VTIFRLIKDSAFGPYQLKVMTEAYEATLKILHLKTGTEPINELIAKKIIGIVQAKEHDPKRICARTIKELGIQDLANSQKFCEAIYARPSERNLGVPPASNDHPALQALQAAVTPTAAPVPAAQAIGEGGPPMAGASMRSQHGPQID
jgi:hypothetical protein